MPIDKPDQLAGEGPFACPCGGTFSISLEPPAVMHPLPVCSDYCKLEPGDFVAMVNDRRERTKETD